MPTMFKRLTRDYLESLIGFATDLLGILPGFILAWSISYLSTNPWLLTLYPGILTVRGCLAGIASGRLSTGLHLGVINPSFRKVTREYVLIFNSMLFIVFFSSSILSLSIYVVNIMLGVETPSPLNIFWFASTVMGLSLILVFPVTSFIGFTTFKRGIDPDLVLYPISSSVADTGATLIFAFLAMGFKDFTMVYILTSSALMIPALYTFVKYFSDEDFRLMLVQTMAALTLVAVISNVSGQALRGIYEIIRGRGSIYVMYPVLIDWVGDASSMIGSRLTTKLALGDVRNFRDATIASISTGASILASSATMLVLPAILVSLLVNDSPLKIYIISNMAVSMAMIPIFLLATTMPYYLFRYRLNPDNFINPISSAIADSLTTITLLTSLILLQY